MHNSGCLDVMEIENRSQWIHAVDDVLAYHPDWKPTNSGAKRLTFTLDHSNPRQWDADKLKMKDVNIKNCWVKGMHTASLALLNSQLFLDTE